MILNKVITSFKKVLGDFDLFFSAFWSVLKLVYQANQKGHARAVLKHFRRVMHQNLTNILVFVEASKEFGDLDAPSYQVLRERSRGLHSLLPKSADFRYSILIPVYRPHPAFFEKAVRSALCQSAPHLEIILGLDGPQSSEVNHVIEKLKAEQTPSSPTLRVIELDREKTGGGISRTTNALAKEATGHYLLLMDHDDWIAPDLLFRYEQCLRLHLQPQNVVLYCNEYKINERDEPILDSYTAKPEHPTFPYVFVNYICHCLLVPRVLWEKVGGLRPECDGAQDFDLCLRLDVGKAQFQNVPFYLYAWRAHSQSTAQSADSKDYATPAGIRALQDYVAKKSLDWEISEGNFKTVYRAIPRPRAAHVIQVVIPFKDQKEMTLKAVESVLNQKAQGVDFRITAVNNRSQDQSIRAELEKQGVEVLDVNEPFNYSRINNFAVQKSRFATTTDCVLFLNNDVELKDGALQEMLRWVDQPRIGMVGARLHFPNQRVQHGGVVLNTRGTMDRMVWNHVDVNMLPEHSGNSKIISICDAVTAACLLMKKETFLKVGGFDEIWYPIAFSDTDLAVRVRRLGLLSLYTPYAWGIHYESASRGPGVHELPEGSHWLFKTTQNRDVPQERLSHHIFSGDRS